MYAVPLAWSWVKLSVGCPKEVFVPFFITSLNILLNVIEYSGPSAQLCPFLTDLDGAPGTMTPQWHLLLSAGNTYIPDTVDAFHRASELTGCYNYPALNNDVGPITVALRGSDSWTGSFVRILFDDSTYKTCTTSTSVISLVPGQSASLDCT